MKSNILYIIVFTSIQINICFGQHFTTYSPNYNQVLIEQNPTFNWNIIEGCNDYKIEISESSNFSNLVISENVTTNSFTPASSLNFSDWYWRVKAIIGIDTILSNTSRFSIFKPNDLSDNILWLDAGQGVEQDGNGMVSTWNDLSTNNYTFNQSTPANKPFVTNNGPNNSATINFSGNQFLDGGDILDLSNNSRTYFLIGNAQVSPTNSAMTFFAKARACDCINRFGFILTSSSTAWIHQEINEYNIFTQGFSLEPSAYKINQSRSQNMNTLFRNKMEIGNNFLSNQFYNYNSNYRFLIGAFNSSNDLGQQSFLNGMINEFIALNSVDTANILKVENYLSEKYSKTMVNLGPDTTFTEGFCDKTISAPLGYESYLWNTGEQSESIDINEPGLYWVTTTDSFGRVSTDTIQVERPIYNNVVLQESGICIGQSLTLEPYVPIGNYSFVEWSDGVSLQNRIIDNEIVLSYSIEDENGCQLTSNSAFFYIDSSLLDISLGTDTLLCSGNSIQLNTNTEIFSEYSWNTGNTDISQILDTSGIYILEVTNENGCQNSDTIEVTVIGTAPSLSYSIENEICQGSPLNFSENSTVPPSNTIDEVIWNFGEADSVLTSSGAQIYQDSGLYAGFLEVSTLEGCSSIETFNIRVHPKPILSFSTENYCPYEEISFSASNSYDVPLESYQWEFGQNGNTSTGSDPSYSYGLSGNYNVELISIDTNNCIDTVTQNVYVQPAPVTDVSILNPCEYAVWNLTDNSSIADTFEIMSYIWNYGDGTDSINPVQGKFYENYGDYTVQLILTADNGCMDTAEQYLTVHPNPIINYQVGPACKNTRTEFDDLSTIPQGSINATDWLFNLQFEYNAPSASFNFPTTGIQLVALTSTSDQGCIVDTTFTVDVNEELNANFNVNPEILVSDVPISFINTSVGSDSSYWDFGDGDGLNFNNNIENNISYSNTFNGSYLDVILMTVNDFGCRDTLSKTLLVNEALYDINLETLFAQDINGFLTVGVQIENLGTIPLESLNLTLKTPENGPIQENWSGSILQGENEIYIFNAQPSAFISGQDATERYVCVEAQNANASPYLDLNQENNTKCKNIEGEGLVLLSMFPNPSDQDITISTLLTTSASLEIEFFDQTGRIAFKEVSPELLKGIHSFNIPFSKFEKGVYTVRISDGESSLVNKMIRH